MPVGLFRGGRYLILTHAHLLFVTKQLLLQCVNPASMRLDPGARIYVHKVGTQF
jgi:hypothetical protein